MKSHGQRKSKLQESRVAEELGGRVQPASGATRFEKGDVRVRGSVRAECKTTSKQEYALKYKELLKIQKEAISGGLEVPVMQVEFQGQGSGRAYAVLDWQWYSGMARLETSFRDVIALGESVNIHLAELVRTAGLKTLSAKYWALRVTFQQHKRVFAITPWETFLSLYQEEE